MRKLTQYLARKVGPALTEKQLEKTNEDFENHTVQSCVGGVCVCGCTCTCVRVFVYVCVCVCVARRKARKIDDQAFQNQCTHHKVKK